MHMMNRTIRIFLSCLLISPVLALSSCGQSSGGSDPVPPARFSLVYDANDATGGNVPETREYLEGEWVAVSGNTGNLVKTGYVFSGWNTASSADGDSYLPGTRFKMPGHDARLFAAWTAIAPVTAFTVSFLVDDDGTVYATVLVESGRTIGTLPSAPTKEGFTFDGWWTGKSGGGTRVTSETAVTGNVSVYAKWNAIPPDTPPTDPRAVSIAVTVAIPGDGAITFTPDSIVAALGDALSVSVTETGYASYAWYLDGVEIAGASDSTVSIDTSTIGTGVFQLMLAVTDGAGTVSSGACRIRVTN